MGESWQLRLIGTLELHHNGVPVPIAAAKQRVLIAALALAGGETVTADRLISCLWDGEPPAGARNTLQNHVLRLRRTLAVEPEAGPLISSASGYRLDVDTDAVDVHRFHSLVRSARSNAAAGEPESAIGLFGEALALWRGEPLTDVPSDVLHREVVPSLAEHRLAALEQRIDLELGQGRHRELITELVALTTAHPLRERMSAQLMLALYRSGRAAEALDAYHQAGKIFAEELGIDPGPELQALHQAVLTNDPGLATANSTDAVAARSSPAPRVVVPRQLPPASSHFVGRATEIRQLDARLAAAQGAPLMVISAIGGTAGIGKTALALHWGHRHAGEFPDGQLYVNLQGFDPTHAPMSPASALHGFLTALGVPAQAIPADLEEQGALYRSELAGRRMLIVLDNARDAEQVRPLLPGAPGSLVLVTSRDQLAGLVALDGAVPLTLDLLTAEEAHHLLVRRLGGERVARERVDVDELVDVCARLPLALNIVVARAVLHPNRPLAAFVDELRDTHQRLDALTTGESSADVRAVFSWSYQTLTPATARVFRLLSLHPGPDISVPAAASLTGHDTAATRRALDALTRAHLIIEHAPRRYTMHDLLRAYAVEQVQRRDDEAERDAALRRVVDFYTHTAWAAEHLLNPTARPVPLDPPAPDARPHPLPDRGAAVAWLDAERAVLLSAQQAAADRGWHLAVWQLAWATNELHTLRGHRNDHVAVWQTALDAAAHLPDPGTRSHAHRRLGSALADLGQHEEAIAHVHQSLALAEQHDDRDRQAAAHFVLASIWAELHDDRQALEHATRCLDLRRTLDQPVLEAEALNTTGWYLAQLGEFDAARTHCEAANAIHRRHHDTAGEATTLDSLGYIHHHSGDHARAIEYFREALSRYDQLGHIRHTADTLSRLGHAHAALGEYEQTRAVWRKALTLCRQQGRDAAAASVQRQLDALGQ